MEAAGLKASDKRVEKVADDTYNDWLQKKGLYLGVPGSESGGISLHGPRCLLLDLEGARRSLPSAAASRAAPVTGMAGAAPGFFDALAEARHEALFEDDRLGIPKAPEGFRAEDVLDSPDLEGFVTMAECAKRMEVSEEQVLELARSGYLLARWHRGQLLIRPGVM